MYDHMNHHCPVRSTISGPAGVKAGIDKTDRQPTRESCCGHVCSSTAWHTQPSEVLPDSRSNIFAMHEALCGGHQLLTSLCPPILGSLITLCTAWPLLVIDHLLMRWPIMKKLERHMTPSVTGQVSVGFFFIPGLRGNLSTSGQIDLLSAVCPTSVVRSSISSPLHSRGLVGDD